MSGWFRIRGNADFSSEVTRSSGSGSCSYTVRESSRCHSATDAEGNPVQRCEKTREVLKQCVGKAPEVIEFTKEEVEKPCTSSHLLPFGGVVRDVVRDAGDAFRRALDEAGDDVREAGIDINDFVHEAKEALREAGGVVREATQEARSLGVVLGDVLGDVGRLFSLVEKSMGEVLGGSAPRDVVEVMLGDKVAEEATRGRGQVEMERGPGKESPGTTFERYSKDFVEV